MSFNAINTFKKVLDDSNNIISNIRTEVFVSLDLGNYEQLNEYVKESLEHFSFNVMEKKFFEQIRNVVNEEMDRGTIKIRNNEQINYTDFSDNLIRLLRQIQKVDINLDDDFRNLARNINARFPLIASDDWYARLRNKKEQITSVIEKYNQGIIDVLIKLTPQFASELAALENKSKSNNNDDQNNQQKEQIKQHVQQSQSQQIQYLSANDFHSKCMGRLEDINLMFQNAGNDKTQVAKVYRDFKKFVDSLSNTTYTSELLQKYSTVSEYAISMIYDQIMFENVPMLKEVFYKYQSLLNDDSIRKTSEPLNPKPSETIETYVGASNEDIVNLIKQNKYFSLLHGINKDNIVKYNNFISKGYNILMGEWQKKASNCKTYDEKHDAYFELYEIYQNFRDYISIEQSHQLRELLDNIESYLQQHRPLSPSPTEMVGVRYNSEDSSKNNHSNSMR